MKRFTVEIWVCEYGVFDNLENDFVNKPTTYFESNKLANDLNSNYRGCDNCCQLIRKDHIDFPFCSDKCYIDFCQL
jgi:hypothetical protein